MIEITVNDRLGKKVRVKCNEDDTIGDLKVWSHNNSRFCKHLFYMTKIRE
jgi:hypothetical protein